MHLFRELKRREEAGQIIQVAVVGAGSMGRGIAYHVDVTSGMRPAVIVNRHRERAVQAYVSLGYKPDEIVCSDDFNVLQSAVQRGVPAATTDPCIAVALPSIDVVVEATGTVEYAAQVSLWAIEQGKHLVCMNAEMDTTVGCLLNERARRRGVVYTNSDGDQPGVLMRLIEWVRGTGFEVVAAVNCKGFLDVQATPESILPWAVRMKTSPNMVCAFTDGTKMNMENAIVSNATGFIPEKRGMHGVRSDLNSAVADFQKTLTRHGVVDYTLGGDFAGGVFVLGYSDNAEMVGHYLDYLKMGPGPYYMFYRPYHLCHVETPLSVAEAALYQEPTIAPRGAPVVEVVAIAKRDLQAGEMLDGIGGYTCYGEIDTAENAAGLLPMGLTVNVRLNAPVKQGEPIPMEAVDLDPDNLVVRLRREQSALFGA